MAALCNDVKHGSDGFRQTVALRDEILRKPLGLEFSADELAGETDSFHLACWHDGVLTACLVLKPLSARSVRMRQLAVRTDWQRKGVGSLLVAYSESFAREHGYDEIVLHAREAAVRFYERAGYSIEGDRFFEVTIPHFTMRKSLDLRQASLSR